MGKQTPQNVTNPPARHADVYEKRYRAAELRRTTSKTWDEIAAEVGYGTKSAACNAVKALLREHQSLAYEEIALYRQESLDRYADLYAVAWPLAKAGSEKHMAVCLRIISAVGDLTGEKAPVQVQIGESDVDRLLRDALQEFNRRVAELDRQTSAGAGDQSQNG